MKVVAHLLLALAVLIVLGGIGYGLIAFRKTPVKQVPAPVIPRVQVVEMKPEAIPVVIAANGTVRARTSTQLTSQVSGQIVSVSPDFQEGGFFYEGDVLVTIDPVRYEAQVATAKAQVAAAQLGLEREEALAKRARRDWNRLGNGEPEGLAANVPQLAKARADLDAALAAVQLAEHDLTQTRIVAPYTGRVRTKMADVGQSVSALAVVLADIYAVDYSEVVVPLASEDANFLILPALGVGGKESLGVPVTLGGQAGDSWQGVIDRSTGIVDPQSRFVSVIVRVNDPYGLETPAHRERPLQIGTFVKVSIPGKVVEGAFSVPREAVLPGDRVLVVSDSELRGNVSAREVTIVRKESERVLVTKGLKAGERVVVTRLSYYAEGMEVEPLTTDAESGDLIDKVNAL